MKKLLLAVSLLTSVSVQAEESDTCSILESYARSVMTVRQGGISLKEMMDLVGNKSEAGKKLILIAYDKPRYSSDNYKEQSINDFSNNVYLGCLRASK